MEDLVKNGREGRVVQKAISLIDEFENTRKNKMPLFDGNEYVVVLDVSLNPVFASRAYGYKSDEEQKACI